jgi:hypothetical protein
MWTPRRRPEQEQLNRYWNALNRGAPPEELARLAAPLDPSLIAAIDRARALHRRRRPDPAFATRLEYDLMDAFTTAPAGSVPLRPIPPKPANGSVAPRERWDWLPTLPVSKERRGWALAQVATALLLLVTLALGYIAFRDAHPAALPPAQASPAAATPTATPTTAPALPPDATVGGLGLADWSARAWQWLLSFPSALNPALDTTSERCSYGQSGPVFYLAISPGNYDPSAPRDVTRSCTVPAGVAIFAAPYWTECSDVEKPPFFGETAAAQRACATAGTDSPPPADLPKIRVTVDGQSVGSLLPYRTVSPQFTILLPPGNLLGVTTLVGSSVSDGYAILLAPLPVGPLIVTVETPYAGGVGVATYRLAVVAPAGATQASPVPSQ